LPVLSAPLSTCGQIVDHPFASGFYRSRCETPCCGIGPCLTQGRYGQT